MATTAKVIPWQSIALVVAGFAAGVALTFALRPAEMRIQHDGTVRLSGSIDIGNQKMNAASLTSPLEIKIEGGR